MNSDWSFGNTPWRNYNTRIGPWPVAGGYNIALVEQERTDDGYDWFPANQDHRLISDLSVARFIAGEISRWGGRIWAPEDFS